MKTIHLTEDLNAFLHEAVHSGRYANEDSVISDALTRLRQTINVGDSSSGPGIGTDQPGKPLTKQQFQRHLVEIGLLDPPVAAGREPDKPTAAAAAIPNEEEVLSEVLIRERLIEWLTGFLS